MESTTSLAESERRILEVVQQNGRISNVDLAKQVGLSESPCLRRLKQLEDAGIIKSYAALLDAKKLGFDVSAFIQLSMDQRSEKVRSDFMAAVKRESLIVECYAVSGGYDYLLKVIASDLDAFSDFVMNRLLQYPGVKDMSSGFVLKEVKASTALPLDQR